METLKYMDSALYIIEQVNQSFSVGSVENRLLNEAIVQLRIAKGTMIKDELGIQL